MSRFNRLSQAIWHCKYHIIWTPKYRNKILKGPLKEEVSNCINVFNKFPYLKKKPYWGNNFWSPGYCVDTIGLDEEMIRKYVKY